MRRGWMGEREEGRKEWEGKGEEERKGREKVRGRGGEGRSKGR